MNWEKLGLEKAEEPEIKLPTFTESWRKQRNSKKAFTCFTDYVKALDYVDHDKLRKILKEMGTADHLTCLLSKLWVKKQQLEPYMEQLTGSQLGKEYIKAVCDPAYLTSMQSTSCEMLGWMNHKLESRLPGEILTTSYMHMIPL